jgi:hypothetical protein
MIYSINYDLHRPGQNYEDVINVIKSLGAWWHYLDSTWLVDTTLNAAQIWAKLEPHIDTNDNFLIIGVTRDYSGWLPEDAWKWIKERYYRLAA